MGIRAAAAAAATTAATARMEREATARAVNADAALANAAAVFGDAPVEVVSTGHNGAQGANDYRSLGDGVVMVVRDGGGDIYFKQDSDPVFDGVDWERRVRITVGHELRFRLVAGDGFPMPRTPALGYDPDAAYDFRGLAGLHAVLALRDERLVTG